MRFRASLRLREKPPRWKVILKIPNERRTSEPPDVYSSCAGPAKTDDGFRLIWIRSAQKAIQDAQTRKEDLRHAELALRQLSAGLNRRHLKKRRIVNEKVRAILRKYKVDAWLRVTLHEYEEVSTRYLGSGRPRPDAPVRTIRTRKLRLQVQRDDQALRREAHTDGVFPLITNLERMSKKDVLLIYKYQPYVEKRFALIKTEHEIAPVYLKKPQRVAGLLHAYFIALAVAALIERQVRKGMLTRGIKELPLLPEGRMTATPTAARILEAFTNVSWYEFERGEETVAFPIKLTPLQTQLLELLEVPRSVYA
jgi:transposase